MGVPYIGITGVGIRERIEYSLSITGATSKIRPFALPDFVPPRASIFDAQGFSDEPMPLGKIKKQAFLILEDSGYGGSCN